MASAAADHSAPDLPPGWNRLGNAVDQTLTSLAQWRRRALDAEGEVERLREAMNDLLKANPDRPEGDGAAVEEVQRLRAENALYLSRIMEARKRVSALLARVAALEEER